MKEHVCVKYIFIFTPFENDLCYYQTKSQQPANANNAQQETTTSTKQYNQSSSPCTPAAMHVVAQPVSTTHNSRSYRHRNKNHSRDLLQLLEVSLQYLVRLAAMHGHHDHVGDRVAVFVVFLNRVHQFRFGLSKNQKVSKMYTRTDLTL
jgi:hypothetical protein